MNVKTLIKQYKEEIKEIDDIIKENIASTKRLKKDGWSDLSLKYKKDALKNLQLKKSLYIQFVNQLEELV